MNFLARNRINKFKFRRRRKWTRNKSSTEWKWVQHKQLNSMNTVSPTPRWFLLIIGCKRYQISLRKQSTSREASARIFNKVNQCAHKELALTVGLFLIDGGINQSTETGLSNHWSRFNDTLGRKRYEGTKITFFVINR